MYSQNLYCVCKTQYQKPSFEVVFCFCFILGPKSDPSSDIYIGKTFGACTLQGYIVYVACTGCTQGQNEKLLGK